MSTVARRVMAGFYRRADGHPERLPWHRDKPGDLLAATVTERGGRGRALDLGCGAGTLSVWLAEQGMTVTGLDLFDEAVAMGRAQALDRGVDVEFVRGDLRTYVPDQPFDLVLDSGCLHSLVHGDIRSYRRQLLTWLNPGADFLLDHWGKRHPMDWRPIGPRRRSTTSITRTFAPELELVDHDVTDFATPLPFGPTVRGVSYRFRRAS